MPLKNMCLNLNKIIDIWYFFVAFFQKKWYDFSGKSQNKKQTVNKTEKTGSTPIIVKE